MKNIEPVVSNHLCVSCGLCAAACRNGAIKLTYQDESLCPVVKGDCVTCGICSRICPGLGDALSGQKGNILQRMTGNSLNAYSAWSLDAAVFCNAVSGGVVTQLVGTLLEGKIYDAAFLLGDVASRHDCKMQRFVKGDDLSQTQKSKYVQASHKEVLEYMLAHRAEKAIIVAVPCAVRGLRAAVEAFHLNPNNYLFIGLFCDRTMTSNTLLYLQSLVQPRGVKRIDFRTKAISGWPGDLRIVCTDNEVVDFSRKKRMEIKDYFQPECCLYCMDKLNVYADISVGDDYTNDNLNANGANSVIIRSSLGQEIWDQCSGNIESHAVPIDRIATSQHLEKRTENYYFSLLKEKSADFTLDAPINESLQDIMRHEVDNEVKNTYKRRMHRIELGHEYPSKSEKLTTELAKQKSLWRKTANKLKNMLSKN